MFFFISLNIQVFFVFDNLRKKIFFITESNYTLNKNKEILHELFTDCFLSFPIFFFAVSWRLKKNQFYFCFSTKILILQQFFWSLLKNFFVEIFCLRSTHCSILVVSFLNSAIKMLIAAAELKKPAACLVLVPLTRSW